MKNRNTFQFLLIALFLLFTFFISVTPVLANHPVLVEGESDFDGDGVIGLTEDGDGDRVFGTINAALLDVSQNGLIQIVTSGRFPEVVTITGQVTLEAAPGVNADVDAFLAPSDPRLVDFPSAGIGLQSAPGIVIDSTSNRSVEIRNIQVVNWTDGIIIRGDSHVLLDGVRIQNNINHGIRVQDNAQVAIRNSTITSTGFRLNGATGDFPSDANVPMRGDGVRFEGRSTRGSIHGSTLAGNFRRGLSRENGARVRVTDTQDFDNLRRDDL